MSSPHYIPTPKLVVFLKSSEKDRKSEEEEDDDDDDEEEEERVIKKESKLESENSENACKQTTASGAHDHGDNDDGDDDDDDGYHTPTSPCHRIPEALKCPPAPKRRRNQRSSSDQLVLGCKEIFYSVVVCEVDEDDIMPKAKKARGELQAVANDNSSNIVG
ncbi:uncharacterized protein A4U43_C07F2050 [Asparagus officinalis]|uniref:Uncharacterized protein n=1 Tax=Asparagus officinalis TaxID=4686 RepID=A0A5P1E8W3_ASPOF|nr:uncharacterized protein A4U43_C07F2050 [Asparagus officinalis]